MDITSDKQLMAIMKEQAENALSNAADEILEIFKKEFVLEIAYIKDPKEYQRTMEFLNAWDFTDVRGDLKRIFTELWYDPSKMATFDPDRFIHGSKYSSPNDIRETLPSILEGKQSSLWISVYREKKFWVEFMENFVRNGRLDALMHKHFKSLGFVKY